MQQLEGRVAVVTGAGSGIGRGLALRFAGEGMRVALADVQADALAETEAALAEAGAEVTSRVTDVSVADDVEGLADHVYDTFGATDVLCNNAGVFSGGLVWERPLSDLQWVLGVNLWGIMHGIRAFVPRMLAQDTEGHIVNTVSAAGLVSAPFAGAYTIAKFAALGATESLAHDLAASGAKLKVTALCPGSVRTGIARSARNRPEALGADESPDHEFVEQMLADNVERGIAPDQVAAMVVDAIRAERFLLLTHPASYAPELEARLASLLAGELPAVGNYE